MAPYKTMLMLGTAVLFAQPALAQTPASGAEPQAAGQASENGELAEIIVTAQQRGENLQKAALPVAVVTAQQLVDAGATGIGVLNKLVPALQIQSGSQGNLIFIRGVGNFSITPSSDPASAYNYDGVYVGRTSSSYGGIYDLERLEVLKGPQGTLYGRNATAGAINVLPAQPRLGETSGYAVVSYGNYDALTAEGAVNLGLGDKAGLRLSGSFFKHDGYLSDGTQGERSYGLRGQYKVELTPDLTVRVAADYAHQGSTGSGTSYVGKYAFNAATGQFVITPSGLPAGEGMFTTRAQAYRTTNGTAGSIAGRLLDPLALRPFLDNQLYGVAAHVDWQTPIGTVSIIPAWRKADKNNLSTDGGILGGDIQTAEQYSIEARLVSQSNGPIDYILGAYYFDETVDDDTHNGAGIQSGYTIAHYRTRSPAAYGRLTWHATDTLRFTGGLRYTEDRKRFNSLARTLTVACTVPAACPTAPLLPYTLTLEQQPIYPAATGGRVNLAPGVLVGRTDVAGLGELNTGKTTWRGAVEFDVRPRSLLYASIETGYRAGGFNTAFNYNPENITAYTLGSKNRFLDNRLQLNLELFNWKYRGQQLSYLGVDPLGRAGVITQNIGRSTIRGAEVEARALVTPTTTLTANVQYLHARYDSFQFSTPSRPLTGCAVTQTTTFNVDCSGRPVVNSPKWTVNLGGEKVIPLGNYRLTLSADTQYRGSRYVGFDYIAPEHVGSTWTSSAQVSISGNDSPYSLTAYVRNIENDRYATYGTGVPGSNLIVALPAAPRLYGVRLAGKF